MRTKIRRDAAASSYLGEITSIPLLTADQERRLGARVAEGDPEARDLLISANLRLVVKIARGYVNRGVALDDLIAEGNLGLMRAAEGFDQDREIRFSTYASYWIKQSIRALVIKQGRPIRVPHYLAVLLAKWRRVAATLAERLGRPATEEEVGQALGLGARKFRVVRDALRTVELAFHGDAESESGEGGCDPRSSRVLVDDRGPSPEEALAEAEELGRILKSLGSLDARQERVLRLRFGLDDGCERTLREVGEELGLTRERVRQLEHAALGTLADKAS